MPHELDALDEFPMIEVKKMNETEIRLLAMLFNLLREATGISFQKFRKMMPRYYHNQDIDSDRKKIYRDLNQLKTMGFNIKVKNFGYQSEDHYPYYLEKEALDQVLKFTKQELEYLSLVFCSESDFENETLLSLSQKLFSKNLELYPKGIKVHRQKKSDSNISGEESSLSKIIQALKDKRALVITYGKEKKDRTIEPYRLIRKNSEDFYLLAYDRIKKDLRRFLLPRIDIKKELREDFLSNKKITSEDLNFHPLSFKSGDAESFQLAISPKYVDSFKLFLAGFTYKMEGDYFQLTTTNKEAIFPFLLKYPDALLPSSAGSFQTSYQAYLKSFLEIYKLVI